MPDLALASEDLPARARRLGVSTEALQVLAACPVVDLHVDTFIPVRMWGYDALHRHGPGWLGGRFFGHLDLPRLTDCGVAGAMWSITTNPFRSPAARWQTWQRNVQALRALVERSTGRLAFVRDVGEFHAARAAGAHAVLLSVQGGNAFQGAPDLAAALAVDRLLTRVTLVHLTDAVYGPTSSPLSWRRSHGLSHEGHRLVEALDAARVFVDLAHIRPKAFWGAVKAHDNSLPLLVTHTGVAGVRPHWRNLDDDQVRAVAASGGVVGIIFAEQFLRRRGGPDGVAMVLEHLQHVIDLVGDAHAGLGSDYDGAVVPPIGMRDGLGYARLVQAMLDRGWHGERIARILGGNALRALAHLRPM